MTPSDFTLDYFKLCLSQHVWGWRDMPNAFDRQKHSSSEDFLLHIAYTNGQAFVDAFNAASPQQTFPFNLTEKPNTKPKLNTPMTPIQITINVPEFEKLADAINRLADVNYLANQTIVAPATTTTISTSGGETEAPAAPEAPAPAKKRGRPAKAETAPVIEEAPAPVAAEPAPAVEAEIEPALPELTGVDLARKASELFAGEEPLKVEMRKKLVDFRTNTLGWDQPISKLTDQALLYQFNEKLDELADEMAALAASAKEEEV